MAALAMSSCSPLLSVVLAIGLLSVPHGGAVAVDVQASSDTTPVSKVIKLLEEMVDKGTKEKADEATRFSAFSQWCENQKRIKADEIQEGSSKMEMTSAKIGKAAALIKQLSGQINDLDLDASRWTTDAKKASEVREKENTDYKTTSGDYLESLDALDKAITVLKKKAGKVEQAAALLQVHSLRLVPTSSKQVLASFLQEKQSEEDEKPKAPEAYGYESQSGGVIEMLEKLKDEFEKQKDDLDREETIARHSYDEVAQQLRNSIKNAEHQSSKKTNLRAEAQKQKGGNEGELAQATADHAEDEKYLQETTALCSQKEQDFASRQKLRSDELDAINQAIEIMSGDSVSGSAGKHLPSLLAADGSRGASLAQLRRSGAKSHMQAQVAAFLAESARKYNSKLLALASEQASVGPWDKVLNMIRTLISKLMDESTADSEEEGFCASELHVNKETRRQKTEEIERLSATKEDLTALISKLGQDIQDLTGSVKKLDEAMADATAERAASNDKNEQTVKDAKAGQVAVQQAIAVLKNFYEKSGEATALAQTSASPAEDAPETFDKPYTGLMPEGGGVVSFMEVILSDFARLESDTSSSEVAEKDGFDSFMLESAKDKALKQTEMKQKAAKKSSSEDSLSKADEELKLTQEQLDKAGKYYEKLKPKCVTAEVPAAERAQNRRKEMASLKDALKIMKETDLS